MSSQTLREDAVRTDAARNHAARNDPVADVPGGTDRGKLLWVGIGMLVIGLLAVAFPLVATLVSAAFVGWLFIVAGIAGLAGAFSHRYTGMRFALFAIGVLRILVGGYLVSNPLGGAVALTLVVAALFVVDGLFGVVGAFSLRPAAGWGWVLASAIVSIVAGAMIFGGLPGSSLVILGLIVGATFVFDGVSGIVRSRMA